MFAAGPRTDDLEGLHMHQTAALPILAALGLLAAPMGIGADGQRANDTSFTNSFQVEKAELSASGRNAYFILEPGYQLVLEGGGERVTITVLDETKVVNGVETRVVEERETQAGRLAELTRNYFAISRRSNDVFYFGEDVNMYSRGKVVAHSGSWLAGVKGARFGLLMPAQPVVKAKFYQEISPGVAMDRSEVVSTSETVKTPAGEFKNCVKIKETTPVEPGTIVYKYFAPEIGLVQSDSLKLVRYGKAQG
jgi:hypothetical protein